MIARITQLRAALLKPNVAAITVTLSIATPFLIAAVVLSGSDVYVGLDLAQTEMRVRDVFSSHPPLIGLPGRLGVPWVHVGSHPGPLSFYALAPMYKVLGSSPWALLASSLSINFLWIAIALWIGWRRGRVWGLYGIGLLSLVTVHAFGLQVVLQPWNPYLPLMAWTVVLLAAWSVLDGDIAMLPILVISATYCMQTHVSYFGPSVVIVLVATLPTVAISYVRERAQKSNKGDELVRGGFWFVESQRRLPSRQVVKWTVLSIVAGVLLWFPPVYEQLHHGANGNLRIIYDSLVSSPAQPRGGLSQGANQVLIHLNPTPLLTGNTEKFHEIASIWPGLLLLGAWIIASWFAWKLRVRMLVAANAILTFALLLAVAAFSQIYGVVWWYLTLWAWTIATMMIGTTVWTLILVIHSREIQMLRQGLTLRYSSTSLAILFCIFTGLLTLSALQIEVPERNISMQLSHVVPKTITAIRQGKIPKDRGSGMILLTWTDPINFGSSGYSMLDELNGHGIGTGMRKIYFGIIPRRLVVPPGTERGIVHIAIGNEDIKLWRERRDAIEVAYSDVRNSKERDLQENLRSELAAQLKANDIDAQIFDYGFGPALQRPMPQEISRTLTALEEIGEPMAVFLAPPERRS